MARELNRPYTVGLVLSTDISSGGANNYEKQLHREIESALSELGIGLIVFTRRQSWYSRGVRSYSNSAWQRLAVLFQTTLVGREISKRLPIFHTELERKLRRNHVDLAYFASPNALSRGLINLPFLFTVWDLGHRDIPSLPEVSNDFEWQSRDALYRSVMGRASHIFTDSVWTGQRLERVYGLEAGQWTPTGLFVAPPPKLERPSKVSGSYLIYPAQRWPHKNHKTLLDAIARLVDHPELKLVLTGGDKGTGEYIQNYAQKLGLSDRVLDLGFVDESELSALISGASALVMPSLLGPTNIPPFEAIARGVPAVVSDAHHFDEDVATRFVYARALDAQDWEEKIREVIKGGRVEPYYAENSTQVKSITDVIARLRSIREVHD